MSGQLARVSIPVGLGKETTPGVAVVPTIYLPVSNPTPQDVIATILDTSIQSNDSAEQDAFPGPAESTLGFDMLAYPVEQGYLWLGMLGGADTVTAAVTTTAAASITAGTATASLTASVPVYSTLTVDTGTAKEARQVVSVTGAGPYTVTVDANWNAGHSSGVAAVTGTLHAFKQPTFPQGQPPSWSITDYRTGVNTKVFAGCKVAQLGLKYDAKGSVMFSPAYRGYPSASASQPTPAYTQAEPLLGWQWKMFSAGALSTRNLTADLTVKRSDEAVHSSDGTQGPREVFLGALSVEGKVTQMFDASTDEDTYLNYVKTNGLAFHTSSPRTGAGLTVLLSKPVITDFNVDRSGEDTYAKANYTVKGMYNATDGGSLSAYLTCSKTTAF